MSVYNIIAATTENTVVTSYEPVKNRSTATRGDCPGAGVHTYAHSAGLRISPHPPGGRPYSQSPPPDGAAERLQLQRQRVGTVFLRRHCQPQ